MNTVLYFSVYGAVYETRAYTTADINQLVHDHGLHCSDLRRSAVRLLVQPVGTLVPASRESEGNRTPAGHNSFHPQDSSSAAWMCRRRHHDADGELDGLSWQQLDRLARRDRSLTKQQRRALGRHINRADGRRNDPLTLPHAATGRTTSRSAASARPAGGPGPNDRAERCWRSGAQKRVRLGINTSSTSVRTMASVGGRPRMRDRSTRHPGSTRPALRCPDSQRVYLVCHMRHPGRDE